MEFKEIFDMEFKEIFDLEFRDIIDLGLVSLSVYGAYHLILKINYLRREKTNPSKRQLKKEFDNTLNYLENFSGKPYVSLDESSQEEVNENRAYLNRLLCEIEQNKFEKTFESIKNPQERSELLAKQYTIKRKLEKILGV